MNSVRDCLDLAPVDAFSRLMSYPIIIPLLFSLTSGAQVILYVS